MNGRGKIKFTRIAAFFLLLFFTLILIFVTESRAVRSISFAISTLTADPSDEEMYQAQQPDEDSENVTSIILAADKKYDIDAGFIEFCINDENINTDGQLLSNIIYYIGSSGYRDDMWGELTGLSFSVLYDIYTGAAAADSSGDPSITVFGDLYESSTTTISFAGDVNLSYDWYLLEYFRAHYSSVEDCFSSDLLDLMRGSDIFVVNNEFSISTRGTALSGKLYTFRADPDDIHFLTDIGVDLVTLANNHVYDYGEDAFFDTISHLEDAGIITVGAGESIDEASKVKYIISGGMKIAFCAASSAETNRYTPVADEETAGVMGIYDTAAFLAEIEEAAANSDYVVVLAHFGTENSNTVNDTQRAAAEAMIDAGADIVVGAHPHVLQPIEYYNGGLIAYSLGNFWFNMNTVDTGVLTVSVDVNLRTTYKFTPCIQSAGAVTTAEGDELTRIIEWMNSVSDTAVIGENLKISEK
ncbi:MAG: CapA family protein [Clostridia bacterium]|nr:CapA family protein [Clostridia bacterium]